MEEEGNGSYWGLCPAHDDHHDHKSLHLGWDEKKQKAWFACRTRKCDGGAILEKLGLEWKDLYSSNGSNGSRHQIVDTYDYPSDTGELLFQVVRYKPKAFKQRRPNGKGGWTWNLEGVDPVLYQLPEMMEAVRAGETIFVCEGEKDADNARERLGVIATTCPMGAKKWRESYTQTLRGADVVVIRDNDPAGRGHVLKVAESLAGVARSVKILELPDLPPKGDLTDWIESGGTREEFDSLVARAPEFHSGHTGVEFGRNESLPVKTVSQILAESDEGAEWKVEPLLARGDITDLSGEAKFSGKTTLAAHMTSCILDGKDFMGFPTVQSKVLYLTEQANNFAGALRKAGLQDADGKLFLVQHRDVRAIPWEELVSSAVEECVRLGVDVLVIDTFAAFSGIVGDEENKSGAIRDKMAPLKAAAQEHNLAVLYIRHAGKSGKARGSSQFEAEGDIILNLKRPEGNHDENVRILEGIGRYDEIPRRLTIALTDDGYVVRGSDDRVEFRRAVEAIKQHAPTVSENAVTQDELHENLKDEGVSKKTMQRALEWLVEEGTARKKGKGVKNNPFRYWMPEAPPPPPPPDGQKHSGQTPAPNGRNRKLKKEGKGGKVVPFPRTTGRPDAEPNIQDRLIIDSDRLLTEVVPTLERCEGVALDIETTGLSPIEDRVRLLSLYADGETFFIDCFAVDPSEVLEVLKDKFLYIHGAEFDLSFLYHAYGFAPTRTPIDTFHLSQVVRAGEWEPKEEGGWQRMKHSLEDALMRELGVKLGDKTKYQNGRAWQSDLGDEHLQYAAGDVVHLRPLADKLLALLEERGLEETWKLEYLAKPLFLEMCYQGIPFDKKRWNGLVGELEGEVLQLKERADALAPPHPDGEAWNWFSRKQAKDAFKQAGLEIPDLKRETLSRYKDPFVVAVSKYRDAKNELSRVRTWHEGRYKNGRVYPQWNPAGAATGRASCSSPNVQSLAKEGGFRRCIRAEERRVLVKADLSQMELRVLAAITEDEAMLEVFRRGEDLHLNTAEVLSGRKVEKGDPERQKAKAVNFGLSFGMGAKRFKEEAENDYGVKMTQSEAKEAKRKLLAAYPAIGSWHEQEAAKGEAGDFETFTLMGRRRVVEPAHRGKPSFTERLNAPVQGTAADILKLALAKLWKDRSEHPGANVVLTVHDEVVIEANAEDAQETVAWLSETLRRVVEVVLGHPELAGEDVVETHVSDSWEVD